MVLAYHSQSQSVHVFPLSVAAVDREFSNDLGIQKDNLSQNFGFWPNKAWGWRTTWYLPFFCSVADYLLKEM